MRLRTSASIAVLVTAVALLSRGEPAASQPRPATSAEPGPAAVVATVTRVYDVRDLLIDVPNFTDSPDIDLSPPIDRPAGEGAVFPGIGGGEDVGKTREELVDDITRLIQETVEPESWQETGGSVGSVREIQGRLVVTHTPNTQKLVEQVLADLRTAQSRTVRIRAQWVLCDRADLTPLLQPFRMDQVSGAILHVDPAKLDAIPRALAIWRAETLCMDGQRVYTFAAQQHPFVSSAKTTADGRIELDRSQLATTLLLDVANTLCADRPAAVITLRTQWNDGEIEGDDEAMRAASAPSTRPAQRPTTRPTENVRSRIVRNRIHEHRTTMRVPLGKMVFVGGITVDTPARTGDPTSRRTTTRPASVTPPQLYLFIEVASE